MFNLFKTKPKPTLDDPVFGHINLDSGHGIDMWSYIPPDAVTPMICIEAPACGPSNAQRQFYTELRNELSSREAECKTFIAQCESNPANLADMTIYAINIGPDEEIAAGQFEIELSDEDAFEIHRVVFRKMKPIGYEGDD